VAHKYIKRQYLGMKKALKDSIWDRVYYSTYLVGSGAGGGPLPRL
jgi:hypothetical protein